MERTTYIESEDKLVVETIYDPSATLEQAAAIRASGPVKVGSKGQEMLLAMVIDMDHIVALKNKGYDLLSPDKDEAHRALLYIQSAERAWMTVEGNPISKEHKKWE